jgi:hypothetical protein
MLTLTEEQTDTLIIALLETISSKNNAILDANLFNEMLDDVIDRKNDVIAELREKLKTKKSAAVPAVNRGRGRPKKGVK